MSLRVHRHFGAENILGLNKISERGGGAKLTNIWCQQTKSWPPAMPRTLQKVYGRGCCCCSFRQWVYYSALIRRLYLSLPCALDDDLSITWHHYQAQLLLLLLLLVVQLVHGQPGPLIHPHTIPAGHQQLCRQYCCDHCGKGWFHK